MTHVVRPAAPRRPPAGHAPSAKGADDGRDSETGWTPWRRRIVIAGAAGLGLAGAIGVGISLGNSAHGQARVLAPTAASVPPSVSPTVEPSTAPVSDHSTGPARRPTHSPSTARSGTPPVVAHSPGPPSRWTAIVAHLDALRAKAFADGDTAELAAVYAPGVAAYSSDVTTLQSLASRGLHAEGFAATVEHVSVESSTPSTERLRVIDQLTGYRLVDASGNVVGAGSARPARRFTMDLVNVGGSWRVAAINPAG
jgi:hypothetical protein